jgi:hypothetical protein
MVDVARQPHSIDQLKELVDMCRLYKVRFMQIHFTDDRAYTLPSKAFPELSEKSEFRYSFDEIKDLVEYADTRGVYIIPEVDTPAHSSSFTRGLPEVFGDHGGMVEFANPKVWAAMDTVVNELCDMFPSAPYIHLGADEANIWGLPGKPVFKNAIEKYKLQGIEGLFNYYINHLNKTVKARGKKTIVWEGFNYGLSGKSKMDEDIAVMMFDNAKSAQAYIDAGHPVINASWNPMYVVGFDGLGRGVDAVWMYQWNVSKFHGFYNYPMTYKRTQYKPLVKRSPKLIGAQLCSWEMLGHREVPRVRFRMGPYADRVWNPANSNDYANFEKRYKSVDLMLDLLLAKPEAPATPVDAAASDGFYKDKIRVCWRDGGNYPIRYVLYKNTTDDSNTAKIISAKIPRDATYYDDFNVVAGKKYYYWVKALNNWGRSDFSTVAVGTPGTKKLAEAYEPFDYEVGIEIDGQNGGKGFDSAWKLHNSTGPIKIIEDSLYYTGVASMGGALRFDHTNEHVAVTLERTFDKETCNDASEIWLSYLIRGEKVANGEARATLNHGRPFGKENVNGIGIHYHTTVLMENDITYYFLVKIDCRPGNDHMYLWVNPANDKEPSIKDIDSEWEVNDVGVDNKIRFNFSGGGKGKYILDEFRIGTSWEDVTGADSIDPEIPRPILLAWESEPAFIGSKSISMTCAKAKSPGGVEYYFKEVSGNPGGSDSGWQSSNTYVDKDINEGCVYAYKVKARRKKSKKKQTYWSETASNTAPYKGKIQTIPGKIEVENYDIGNSKKIFKDTDSGNNGGAYRDDAVDLIACEGGVIGLAYTSTGEWLTYSVNAQEGTYDITANFASAINGAALRVSLDDKVLCTFDVPNTTGWETWKTTTIKGIPITGGTGQKLRLDIANGGLNLDWITFTPSKKN